MPTRIYIRSIDEKPNYFLGNSGAWTIHSGEKAALCQWVNGQSRFSGNRCATLISKIIACVASFFGMGKILRFSFDPSLSKETLTFWVSRDLLKRDQTMIASEQTLGNPDFYPDAQTELKVRTKNWLHVCSLIHIEPNPQNNSNPVSSESPPGPASSPPKEDYTSQYGTEAWMEEFKAKTKQWEQMLTRIPFSPTKGYQPPQCYQGL